MKENKKDLLYLCLSACSITYTHIWPSIFSYYCSYCYHKDPSIIVN